MPMHHSEETHQLLVQRVPQATGRALPEWFEAIENGPAFLRFDERVNWLRDEYDLSKQHADTIVHEYDKKKASKRVS